MVLFKGGICRVSSRFHLFVSDVINGMKSRNGYKIFLHDCRNGNTLLRSYAGC